MVLTMSKELIFEKCSPEEADKKGYPSFNDCGHYIVDMSHLQPGSGNWLNTISIKLPNENSVTICVMQTCKDETCIDTKFHGDSIKDTEVIGFGGDDKGNCLIKNHNLYAVIAHSKN